MLDKGNVRDSMFIGLVTLEIELSRENCAASFPS